MNQTSRFARIPRAREAAGEDNPGFMKRLIVGLATTVLVSGGLGLASLEVAAGTAEAGVGPYQWCPGQSLPQNQQPNWDMNVCHTWYFIVPWRVQSNTGAPNVWNGDGGPPPDGTNPCYPACL
jgi:hypothetical protein